VNLSSYWVVRSGLGWVKLGSVLAVVDELKERALAVYMDEELQRMMN
jgi:hypothetical protein